MEILNLDQNWDKTIASLPGAHLLQTREWAEVKEGVGWKPYPLVWKNEEGRVNAAALLLIRSVRILRVGPRVAVAYVPRGPMLDWASEPLRKQVFSDLQAFSKKEGCLFLKVDPELRLGTGVPGREDAWKDPLGEQVLGEMKTGGWHFSSSQIQFRNTALLDLSGIEEEWLKRMKQKTRYNLRLAQKNGVTVRVADESELPLVYRMYAETSVRDGFVIRSEEYYLGVWQKFMRAGRMSPLVAEYEGQMIAGLMLFYFWQERLVFAWHVHRAIPGKDAQLSAAVGSDASCQKPGLRSI
jgi:lipid II:glycine glycyltransferase (peptidoglycan interpeptide bridge formation enzyme)